MVGTEGTDNPLNDANEDEYTNISLVQQLDVCDGSILKHIQEIKVSSSDAGDLIDALGALRY